MSKIANVQMVADGQFKVLGLATIRLPGTWLWHSSDIDEPTLKGAIFRCYSENSPVELAYLLIGDVTEDTDEPDISSLNVQGAREFDKYLEEQLRQMMAKDGRQMIKWMSSQLNTTASANGLVTAYIGREDGRDRQYIDLRISSRNRKLIVAGCFNIENADELAVPIFTALKNVELAAIPNPT